MNVTVLRRRNLGRGSCRGIRHFSKYNITVRRLDIAERKGDAIPADILIRWGCTGNFPRTNDSFVVNWAEHIHLVGDKKESRRVCVENDVSVPDTWFSVEEFDGEFPVIVRYRYHHQGRRLYLINSMEELNRFIGHDIYISSYIPKEREFRVYCFFGRVIAMAEKFVQDKTQIAWNNYKGGHFENVRWRQWDFKSCHLALEFQKAIGIDFCGVDIIALGDERYVIEGNSAPSLTSPYRKSVFAKAFDWVIDYYVEHGKKPAHFEIPKFRKYYPTYLLPCLENRE